MVLLEIMHLQGIKGPLFILLFIIFAFFLLSFVQRNSLRLFLSILVALLISSEASAIYSTREFISYSYFIHSNISGAIGLYQMFILQIILGSIFVTLLILLFYFSHKLFQRWKRKWGSRKQMHIVRVLGLVLPVLIVAVEGSFYKDAKTFFTLLAPGSSSDFEQALEASNMSDYVMPNKIQCSGGGKNIIILSLESYERAYLSDKYAHLTPNLNRLRKEWHGFDLEQNSGSSWTMGSLYTYLTGFPAFWGVRGNDIFKKAYRSKISSILDVLHKLRYKTVYLNGNTDSTGTRNLLKLFGFSQIFDYRNSGKEENKSTYGIRDKDLFEIAKEKAQQLNQQEEPFALFVSTTDTHWPNGFYDKRMESVISPKKSKLEFMVAAVDYMVGDFIKFLEEKKMLDNTVVYIFPDHLKMGDPTIFNGTGDRGLFLITNSDSTQTISQPIYQIDLSTIILKGAGINHNLKFLTDYIDTDKEKYIQKHMRKITDLNTNGIILK